MSRSSSSASGYSLTDIQLKKLCHDIYIGLDPDNKTLSNISNIKDSIYKVIYMNEDQSRVMSVLPSTSKQINQALDKLLKECFIIEVKKFGVKNYMRNSKSEPFENPYDDDDINDEEDENDEDDENNEVDGHDDEEVDNDGDEEDAEDNDNDATTTDITDGTNSNIEGLATSTSKKRARKARAPKDQNIQRLIIERLATIPDPVAKATERDRLIQYGRGLWAPAQLYFETHFLNPDAPLFEVYRIYEQARLCNPDHIRRLIANNQFTVGIITPFLNVLVEKRIVVDTQVDIANFPDRAILSELIREMSAYGLACQGEMYGGMLFKDKAARVDNFWQEANEFPAWTKLAHHLALLQPSSAAAERVFSRLIAILRRPGMDSALIDNIESVLMLMYNNDGEFDWEDDAN